MLSAAVGGFFLVMCALIMPLSEWFALGDYMISCGEMEEEIERTRSGR